MDLKKNLNTLVESNNISLSSIAETINVPLSTLHGWMNGIEPKSIPQLKGLADYFGLSMEELCFSSDKDGTQRVEPLEKYKEEINAGTFEVILRRVSK